MKDNVTDHHFNIVIVSDEVQRFHTYNFTFISSNKYYLSLSISLFFDFLYASVPTSKELTVNLDSVMNCLTDLTFIQSLGPDMSGMH